MTDLEWKANKKEILKSMREIIEHLRLCRFSLENKEHTLPQIIFFSILIFVLSILSLEDFQTKTQFEEGTYLYMSV